MLFEKNEDECNFTFAIELPIEEVITDTDCNSDASDNEDYCNPDYLLKKILLTNILSFTEIVSTSTEVGPPKNKL